MRRTDEAFKNELFRRYEQYKKNRRNLRILAATPIAATVIIVCALLILPRFDHFLNLDPIGHQPKETTSNHPANTVTPTELEPDNPFYAVWQSLSRTGSQYRISISTLPTSDKSLARSYTADDSVTQIIRLLGSIMQTAGRGCELDISDDSLIYSIEILGSVSSTDENGNVLIGETRQTLSLFDRYLRQGNGNWYEVDGNAVKALINYVYGIYGEEDESYPSITEAEMQALIESGGTYHDLVALIGEPHRDIGSGAYIIAWDLADGRTLLVWAALSPSSISVPIDRYEFWESPLAGLVGLLNGCDVDRITVTPSPSDLWEGATASFTTEQGIKAILGRLISLTKYLSPGDIPTVVEQPDLNAIAYTNYIFEISGNPRPQNPDDYIPDVYLTYTVELLDAPEYGCYLRYSDGASTSEWIQVSTSITKELIDYFYSGEDNPIKIAQTADEFYAQNDIELPDEFFRPDLIWGINGHSQLFYSEKDISDFDDPSNPPDAPRLNTVCTCIGFSDEVDASLKYAVIVRPYSRDFEVYSNAIEAVTEYLVSKGWEAIDVTAEHTLVDSTEEDIYAATREQIEALDCDELLSHLEGDFPYGIICINAYQSLTVPVNTDD